MWTKRKKIAMILHYITSYWLPASRHSSFSKKIRAFWGRKILDNFGVNINIERHATFGPEVTLGDNSGIGVDCEIYGQVHIGNNVMMGPEVIIYTTGHRFDRIDIPMNQQGFEKMQPVVIGDDCWIGRRVMIMPGVSIGNGCVIGAGAVVTKSMPAYSVVCGVPADVVRKRNIK